MWHSRQAQIARRRMQARQTCFSCHGPRAVQCPRKVHTHGYGPRNKLRNQLRNQPIHRSGATEYERWTCERVAAERPQVRRGAWDAVALGLGTLQSCLHAAH